MKCYEVPLNGGYSFSLYAGSYPRSDDAVVLQTDYKVKTLVNLVESAISVPLYIRQKFDLVRFPIEDCGCPTSLMSVYPLIQKIQELLQTQNVYIHCEEGKGRTGLIVACFLVEQGRAASEAITLVRSLSSDSIGEEAQEGFVHLYSQLV